MTIKMEAEPDGHSAFLIFDLVSEEDAGEYECVEAQSGISSSTVRLRVEPCELVIGYICTYWDD